MDEHKTTGFVAVANLLTRFHDVQINNPRARERRKRRRFTRRVTQCREQGLEQQRQRILAANVACDMQQALGRVVPRFYAWRVEITLRHHRLQKRMTTRQRDLGSTRNLAVDHRLPDFGKEVDHVKDAHCSFHIRDNIICISILGRVCNIHLELNHVQRFRV